MIKNKYKTHRTILLSLFLFIGFAYASHLQIVPQFYCTAADDYFYVRLLNLIGSIHRFNFDQVNEIAVFDLGLTANELNELEHIERVKVYSVEQINPEILKPSQVAGRRVIGHFSWKPVVIKQASDKFPYFLYLDAGTTVLANLDHIFQHIIENGYFLIDSCGHPIKNHTISYVLEHFVRTRYPSHEKLLLRDSTFEISAGIQGISRNIVQKYVQPIYELATNIRFFEDDGSAPRGYGFGRHDQVLFSLMAHILGLKINTMHRPFEMKAGNVIKKIHVDYGPAQLTPDSVILVQSSFVLAERRGPENIASIRWQNKNSAQLKKN